MSGPVVYERDDSQLAPEIEASRCESCRREPAEHCLYSGRLSKRERLSGKGARTVYHRDHVHLICDACLQLRAGVVKLGPHQYWVPACSACGIVAPSRPEGYLVRVGKVTP